MLNKTTIKTTSKAGVSWPPALVSVVEGDDVELPCGEVVEVEVEVEVVERGVMTT